MPPAPLDDALAERLLAPEPVAVDPNLAGVAAFVAEMRACASLPPPVPSPELAALLREGRTASVAPTDVGAMAGSRRRASLAGWRRRVVVSALGVGAGLTGIVGAGAAGVLPEPAERVVAGVVRALTPLQLPVGGRTGEGPAGGAGVPGAGRSGTGPAGPGVTPGATAGVPGAPGGTGAAGGPAIRGGPGGDVPGGPALTGPGGVGGRDPFAGSPPGNTPGVTVPPAPGGGTLPPNPSTPTTPTIPPTTVPGVPTTLPAAPPVTATTVPTLRR